MAEAEKGAPHHPYSIYMEPMAPSEAHRGAAACAHVFCRMCLAGYVRAKVKPGGDGDVVVRCPDVACAWALDPELCYAVLPVLRRAAHLYPFPGCSEMMMADDEGEAEVHVTQSECQVCRRLFCARSGVAPWHAGVTCDEYGKLGKGEKGRCSRWPV